MKKVFKSENSMNISQIFAPYAYGNLSVKNRIIRSATNDYSGSSTGAITKIQLDVYEELARGNVGMIISGNFYVSEEGRLDATQNAITEKVDYEGTKQLVDVVHAYNCKMVFQISHAGRKSKLSESVCQKYAIADNISPNDVENILNDFYQGTRRAKICGADGVQLHFGHGYLLGEILEERNDGLDISNKVLKMIRDELPEYPVLVKVNSDIDQERLDRFVQLCEKYNIWAIELSGSDLANKCKSDANYYADKISMVNGNCKVPVILTGGIRSIRNAEDASDMGADLVGISRPLINEPDLLHHWQERDSRCISCNQCFTLYKKEGRRCVFHK